MDTVESLASAVGVALNVGPGRDWTRIEQSLGGLTLPADYKRVVDGFPPGEFKALVRVLQPGSDDYLGDWESRLDDLRMWREDGDGTYPYPLYPEEGGLLPWATTPMAGIFFWLTEGEDPERWPVVLADKGFEEWQLRRQSMSEFLLEIIADPPLGLAELAGGDLATSPLFKPFPPRARALSPEGREEQIRRAGADFPVLPDESEALLAVVIGDGAGAAPTDWAGIAARSGVEFPPDYRRFYDALGPGVFCDITIVGPEAQDGWNLWDLLQTGRDRLIPSVPYVRFRPDAGGVIPWGSDAG
ncbi:hypothetical protein BJ973_004613 [Actinoplanes tereljensis]|uniref:Knr4/Smi1-like domain-containing protein n=1 Tax=Paractinoplanes tereljensis TaxID=571912 RepID=A0A919NTJ1_9ACTN|nr:SMI1/KNR4 family protein [Actinoplanes tereljensis]GIF24000.1 hypothetical protein Ate02nite_67300 [Actinoplanes tereljensis]